MLLNDERTKLTAQVSDFANQSTNEKLSVMKKNSHLKQSKIEETLGLGGHAVRPKRNRRFILVGVLIMTLGTVIWSLLADGGESGPSFTTVSSYRGDLRVTVNATGTLEPTVQVDIGSELSGIIETVKVDYNDQVTTGQLLVTLNTDQLEARILQAEAAVQSARGKLAEAEASKKETAQQLQRASGLVGEGYLSIGNLESAQAAYDRAQAGVTSALAQVSMAAANLDADRTTLAKTNIVSPIDGIVLSRRVEPGQTVAASLQAPVLFTLAQDLAAMELRVDVDEADIGLVHEGQTASFSVDAYPGQVFPAVITSLHFAPQSVNGVVTYEAVLDVTNKELLLRPGMTAIVDIVVHEAVDVLLVPNEALRFELPRATVRESELMAGQSRIWVLSSENTRPIAITVEAGKSDSLVTEVLGSDLESGMAIVTDIVLERKRKAGLDFLTKRPGRG